MKNAICRSSPRRQRNTCDVQRPGVADLHDDTEPFVFPELPDLAIAALHRFLEDLSTAFHQSR